VKRKVVGAKDIGSFGGLSAPDAIGQSIEGDGGGGTRLARLFAFWGECDAGHGV